MVFQPTDSGPFWMSPEEQEKRRHDVIVEGQFITRKRTKKELTELLLAKNVQVKGRLSSLQTAARNNGIPIEETTPKIIEGWEGKPKGLLQVLWERGWIDNTDNKAYQKYTISGRRNEFNLIQPETSLKHLMSSCTDFEEEETMLQLMATLMHIQVDQSPKCHCEVAGEGIEYTWAFAKNHYRRILLEQKRGKEKFMNSVRLCMSREVLT